MKISVNQNNKTIVFKVNGELDIASVKVFKDNLIMVEPVQNKILIDFNGVEFVDSTGVGGLIEVIRTFQDKELSVEVYNIEDWIYELFVLLGIPEIFEKVIFNEKKRLKLEE